MTKRYSSPAEKANWEALRTTPRGRGLVLLRVVSPGRFDIKKQSLNPRAKRHEKSRALAETNLQREQEIGIAPVYRGFRRDSVAQKEWLKMARAWDIAHQPVASTKQAA